jgi:hypothetical protein
MERTQRSRLSRGNQEPGAFSSSFSSGSLFFFRLGFKSGVIRLGFSFMYSTAQVVSAPRLLLMPSAPYSLFHPFDILNFSHLARFSLLLDGLPSHPKKKRKKGKLAALWVLCLLGVRRCSWPAIRTFFFV